MADPSRPVMQGLLSELVSEEIIVGTVAEEYALALNRWEVASRKYAAVRDMVVDQLEKSPYLLANEEWPTTVAWVSSYPRGAFRFIHMNVGDAVVQALQEAPAEPLTLDQLVERLRAGNRTVLPRMVNAALMQKAGVKKDEEAGTYTYAPDATEATSADDLPF